MVDKNNTIQQIEKVYTAEQIEKLFEDIDSILIKYGHQCACLRDDILKLKDLFDLR